MFNKTTLSLKAFFHRQLEVVRIITPYNKHNKLYHGVLFKISFTLCRAYKRVGRGNHIFKTLRSLEMEIIHSSVWETNPLPLSYGKSVTFKVVQDTLDALSLRHHAFKSYLQ